MMPFIKDLRNIRSWTYDELVTEVERLRAVSEQQSKHLAQAMYEKNHMASRENAETNAYIAKLEKRENDWKNAYISLRGRFENLEECHKADFELLNRVKSVLKDLNR